MSESLRRRKYQWNRVLIESDRILNPQFDDAVVYLTGAQVEMLRNVSLYLNRLETYVEEYNPGYYLVPEAADYDDILEIVADLEETLMGNPNTIWGYKDRLEKDVWTNTASEGTNTLYFDTVPEGYVWVVENMHIWSHSAVITEQNFLVTQDSYGVWLKKIPSPPDWTPSLWQGHLVMKEGDILQAGFSGCAENDELAAVAQGYIMKVP